MLAFVCVSNVDDTSTDNLLAADFFLILSALYTDLHEVGTTVYNKPLRRLLKKGNDDTSLGPRYSARPPEPLDTGARE